MFPGPSAGARRRRLLASGTGTVPCTVVFADVSGFTRLSERLARRGREGASSWSTDRTPCFSALTGRVLRPAADPRSPRSGTDASEHGSGEFQHRRRPIRTSDQRGAWRRHARPRRRRGSDALIDASGFSSAVGALARKGTEGAEQLVDGSTPASRRSWQGVRPRRFAGEVRGRRDAADVLRPGGQSGACRAGVLRGGGHAQGPARRRPDSRRRQQRGAADVGRRAQRRYGCCRGRLASRAAAAVLRRAPWWRWRDLPRRGRSS